MADDDATQQSLFDAFIEAAGEAAEGNEQDRARPPPRSASDAVGEFIKKITFLSPEMAPYDKFRDFNELAFCALAKQTALSAERAEELEARYMQIVSTYRDKDTVRAYPELLALTHLTVSEGGVDFLGSVASQMEFLNHFGGQVFTPFPLARAMASMTLSDAPAVIEQDGYLTLCEPASGSGVMILAAADVLEKMGFDPSETLLAEATDVASICYHMTYVQLALRGIPARVVRGNSLSREIMEWAWTPAAIVPFAARHPAMFNKRTSTPPPGSDAPPDFSLT